MTMFGTVCGYAVRRGYAARNVVPDALRELGASPDEPIDTFSRDEVRRLFLALETAPPGTQKRAQALLKATVYIAAVCALRKGEIAALRWSSFDFAQGLIRVDKAVDQDDNLKGPKTRAGVRTVPMPAAVAAVVSAFRPHYVENTRGLLFRTRTGRKVVDVGFYKLWHGLLARAGIERDENGMHRHFHALRHFAGSAWLEAGVPLAEVSRLMGHAHTGVTAQIYAHAIVSTSHRSSEIDRCAVALVPTLSLPSPSITQGVRTAA